MSISVALPPPDLSAENLRQHASRIRDVLDPVVAREGPECLHPNDVLMLHDLFISLQLYDIPLNTLAYSRIHNAVLEVAGKATRWPGRLSDECDALILIWRARFGDLHDIRQSLFGPGGRLHGICSSRDITRAALLKRWNNKSPHVMRPDRAFKHGSLGFKPGQWWINGMFAFYDGIIDLKSTDGGICHNREGAYAIMLHADGEIPTENAEEFTYTCQTTDPGRFRLTAADATSRLPVRILRSHLLPSIWSPRVGVRYEGLYKVTGWQIKTANGKSDDLRNAVFEIRMQRLSNQEPMNEVLKHPLADEFDDYIVYRKTRKARRDVVQNKAMAYMTPQEQDQWLQEHHEDNKLGERNNYTNRDFPTTPSLPAKTQWANARPDLSIHRTTLMQFLASRPPSIPIIAPSSPLPRGPRQIVGSGSFQSEVAASWTSSLIATRANTSIWRTGDASGDSKKSIYEDKSTVWPNIKKFFDIASHTISIPREYVGNVETSRLDRAVFESRCDDHSFYPLPFLMALNAVYVDLEKPEYVDMHLGPNLHFGLSPSMHSHIVRPRSEAESNWVRAIDGLKAFLLQFKADKRDLSLSGGMRRMKARFSESGSAQDRIEHAAEVGVSDIRRRSMSLRSSTSRDSSCTESDEEQQPEEQPKDFQRERIFRNPFESDRQKRIVLCSASRGHESRR